MPLHRRLAGNLIFLQLTHTKQRRVLLQDWKYVIINAEGVASGGHAMLGAIVGDTVGSRFELFGGVVSRRMTSVQAGSRFGG